MSSPPSQAQTSYTAVPESGVVRPPSPTAAEASNRTRRSGGSLEEHYPEDSQQRHHHQQQQLSSSAPTLTERLEISQLKLRMILFGPVGDICKNFSKFFCLPIDADLLPSRRRKRKEEEGAERSQCNATAPAAATAAAAAAATQNKGASATGSEGAGQDRDVFGGQSSSIRFNALESAREAAKVDTDDSVQSVPSNSAEAVIGNASFNPSDAAAAAIVRMGSSATPTSAAEGENSGENHSRSNNNTQHGRAGSEEARLTTAAEEQVESAQAEFLAAAQRNHLASPLSLVDVLVIVFTILNCALLAVYHPVSPPNAVQRYIDIVLPAPSSSSSSSSPLPDNTSSTASAGILNFTVNNSSGSGSTTTQLPGDETNKKNDDNNNNNNLAFSETELLVRAPSEIIVDFDRPGWVTTIEYTAISVFFSELVLRWTAFGRRWMLLSSFRVIDMVITVGSFVTLLLELVGAVPTPSRWVGFSALKLISIPSILFRSHAFPRGTAEMFENLGQAVRRSRPVFGFFFAYVAAFALIFLGLLRGEMKDRCVLNEWWNASHCWMDPNLAQLNDDDNSTSGQQNVVRRFSDPSCAPENNSNVAFLVQHNLSAAFLSDRRNFVCGAIFDETVLGLPERVACSTQQVCVDQTIGTETTGYRCPYGYHCMDVENLYGGSVGFDNYFQALFSTFVASSEKLWFILAPSAADSSMDAFFFVFVVFISLAVVVLNITIVTLCMEYEKSLSHVASQSSGGSSSSSSSSSAKKKGEEEDDDENESGNNNSPGINSASFISAGANEAAAALIDQQQKNTGEAGDNEENQEKEEEEEQQLSCSEALRQIVYDNPAFSIFSLMCCVGHIVVLCPFKDDSSARVIQLIDAADHVFIFVLIAETVFRLSAGPRRYILHGVAGVIDLLLLTSAIAGLVFYRGQPGSLEARAFRATRILRAGRAFEVYYTTIQGWLRRRFGWQPWRIPARWYRALRRSLVSSALLVFVIVTLVIVAGICMEHGGGGWLCRLRVRLEVMQGRTSVEETLQLLALENNISSSSSSNGGKNESDATGANETATATATTTDRDLLTAMLANEIELSCPRATFETFGEAMLTIWQIVSGDDWDLLTYDAMQRIGSFYAVVYAGIFLVGFVVLISVFSSSILAAYLAEAELDIERERDRAEQEKMRELREEEKAAAAAAGNSRDGEHQQQQQQQRRKGAKNNKKRFGDEEEQELVSELLTPRASAAAAAANESLGSASASGTFAGGERGSGVFGGAEDDGPAGDLNFEDDDDGTLGGGSSADFGADGMSSSVAIFERLEKANVGRSRCEAYKLRADRLLRRSVIADLGRSAESDKLLSELERQRAEVRKTVRVDDDDQWQSISNFAAISNVSGDYAAAADGATAVDANASTDSFRQQASMEMQQMGAAAANQHFLLDGGAGSSGGEIIGNSKNPPSLFHGRSAGGEDVVPLTKTEACLHHIQLFCRNLCDHAAFSIFFAVVTMVYVVAQLLSSPTRAPDLLLSRVEFFLDASSRMLCCVELIVKLVAFGPNPNSAGSFWKRSVWNTAEAGITIVGIIGLLLRVVVRKSASNVPIQLLYSLFAFRPIVLVRHSATMQIVLRSLFRAFRDLVEATLVIFLLCFLYGVAGTQLFAGWLRVCILDAGRGAVRADLPLENCTAVGGAWKNTGANFDQVVQSLFSVFILTSRELWTTLMHNTMNFHELGQPPLRNSHFYACVYFLIYSLISFVVTNVFMAVLVEAYNRCKRSAAAQLSLQTIREHNAWVRSERRLGHVLPTVALQVLLGDDGKKKKLLKKQEREEAEEKQRELMDVLRSSSNNRRERGATGVFSEGSSSSSSVSFGLRSDTSVPNIVDPSSFGGVTSSMVIPPLPAAAKARNNNSSSSDNNDDDDGGEEKNRNNIISNNDSFMNSMASPSQQQLRNRNSSMASNSSIEASSSSSSSPSSNGNKHYLLNFRHFLTQLTNHRFFKLVSNAVTLWCFIPLLCIVDPMPDALAAFLGYNEMVLCGLFWLEMLTLLAGRGWRVYVRNAWCRIDGLAAVVALIMLGCRVGLEDFPPKYRTISWFLRLVRIIYIAKGTWFRATFVRYIDTLRSLAGVLALMLVFFIGFASIANRLFGRVVWGPVGGPCPNHQNSFRGMFLSCFFLLRLSLGGGWPDVWYHMRGKAQGCDPNIGDCGPPTPIPEVFFLLFITTFTFVLKNLLVAVAVDVFAASGDYRSLQKVDAQTTVKLWMITQTGTAVTVPAQLRLLYTARVPLNAQVLRFLRSLPPGFPTSPLWAWEALTDDMMGKAAKKTESSSSPSSSEGAGGAGKNNNNDEVAGTSPLKMSFGAVAEALMSNSQRKQREEQQGKQDQQEGQLFFKKRGLLEPAIILRLIEILYVAHQVRTRKQKAMMEQEQKEAAAAEAHRKQRGASFASLISSNSSMSSNNNNNNSSLAAAAAEQPAQRKSPLQSKLDEVEAEASSSSSFSKKEEEEKDDGQSKKLQSYSAPGDDQQQQQQRPDKQSNGDEDEKNKPATAEAEKKAVAEEQEDEDEEDEEKKKRRLLKERLRKLEDVEEEASSETSSAVPSAKTTPERNDNTKKSGEKSKEEKTKTKEEGSSEENKKNDTNSNNRRKRGVTFGAVTSDSVRPSAAPAAATAAIAEAATAPPAAPAADSTSAAAVPLRSALKNNSVTSTTSEGDANNNNAPASSPSSSSPSSSQVCCSFGEICDILFHMAFMAPFAPVSTDRIFSLLDMQDIKLNSTAEDWEAATEFAFNLWLAEQVGSVWISKVLVRRNKEKLLQEKQQQQQQNVK